VTSRGNLDSEFENLKKYIENEKLSRPDYWGGYLLKPVYFEFWQGRENRLHDRICYELENNFWKIKRIAP
jgi:pyridoxamine 5'-phosphate oxidase